MQRCSDCSDKICSDPGASQATDSERTKYSSPDALCMRPPGSCRDVPIYRYVHIYTFLLWLTRHAQSMTAKIKNNLSMELRMRTSVGHFKKNCPGSNSFWDSLGPLSCGISFASWQHAGKQKRKGRGKKGPGETKQRLVGTSWEISA